MKTLTLIFFCVTIILSCDDSYVAPSPSVLNRLALENLDQFINLSNFQNNDVAVFINAKGDTKQLNIYYERFDKTYLLNGVEYPTDYIKISLKETSDDSYGLSITIDQKYMTHLISDGRFSVILSSSVIITPILYNLAGQILLGEPVEQITIANKVFNDVISHTPLTLEPTYSYSKLYYSKSLGIVGFEGLNEEMWAFDHYE